MSLDLNSMLKSYESATKSVRATFAAVLDADSFVELDAFITGENELGEPTGEGVVSGFASIGSKDVAVLATNPDVFDGGISALGAKKAERIISRAIESGLPLVSFIDTTGARVLEGIDALAGFDKILAGYARAYGQIPVITVVKGKCFGMLTYLSGMSDAFICYENAEVATTSPLILSTSGSISCLASDIAKNAGFVTNIVKDDAECKKVIDRLVSLLNDEMADITDDANRVCKGLSASSDVRSVLNEAFDKNSSIEMKASSAIEALTAFASLDGVPVAVVGVDGKLTAKGASKITDFITTAGSMGMPIVTLVNSTGIVADANQESCCLVRNVSDLIYAYNNVSVQRIALVMGKAVGAAYSILASRSINDFCLAWNGAYIAPFDGASAARLTEGEEIAKAKDVEAAEKKFASIYEADNSALSAARKGYLDNVILPNHTRQYLIAALRAI